MNRKQLAVLTLGLLLSLSVRGGDNRAEQTELMQIKLTIGGRVLTGTLADNSASRDFAALLPLTLTLQDYARTEKISDLPAKLSTRDTPPGADPAVGDITYYAPWGNLAIFYRDYSYSRGLVILGRIDSDMKVFEAPGPLAVTIERAE